MTSTRLWELSEEIEQLEDAIARKHQGHLKVNSELGKGSVFTIHHPCIHRPVTYLSTDKN